MINPSKRQELLYIFKHIPLEEVLQIFIEAKATSQYKLPVNHVEKVKQAVSDLRYGTLDRDLKNLFRL